MFKFTIFALLTSLSTLSCFSQKMEYSELVKEKMDQNKIHGVNTFTGIEFLHSIEIQKGLSDHLYKENSGLLAQNIESIKNQFGFETLNLSFDNIELIKIDFVGPFSISIDQLKQALTEKELICRSLIITARLK
jgi:hypothetical protein